jgi:hypothetical protein
MSIEQGGISNNVTIEKIREDIKARLQKASKHPVDLKELKELERSGWFEQNNIEELEACAVAHTLPEFQIMVRELAIMYPGVGKLMDEVNWVAHENAHMNVAEATGHEILGYGIIFFSEGDPALSQWGIHPCSWTKSNISWGPEEILEKRIKVVNAPAEYGDKLSESDKRGIAKLQARLERLRKKDK